MRMSKEKLLNSVEALMEAAKLQPDLVKYTIENEHNNGGYSARVANIRLGILRTPTGTVIFSPEAYYSLENKIRENVKKSILESHKTVEEVDKNLRATLVDLPQNEHEEQLLPMYQAASPTFVHRILTELVEEKVATHEIARRRNGLVTVYKMK